MADPGEWTDGCGWRVENVPCQQPPAWHIRVLAPTAPSGQRAGFACSGHLGPISTLSTVVACHVAADGCRTPYARWLVDVDGPTVGRCEFPEEVVDAALAQILHDTH